MVEFLSVFIVLHSFLNGFFLSRSINDSDMSKLPEPVSKSAIRHRLPVSLQLGMLH